MRNLERPIYVLDCTGYAKVQTLRKDRRFVLVDASARTGVRDSTSREIVDAYGRDAQMENDTLLMTHAGDINIFSVSTCCSTREEG